MKFTDKIRYKTHGIYSKEDVEKYGFEKACLLYEINEYSRDFTLQDLANQFPFIEKERLDKLITELLEEKAVQIIEN